VVPHPSEHEPPERRLGAEEAGELAETMGALASPARLRLLVALSGRELSVEQLCAETEQAQSATSHNLRLLRGLRLVRARRAGRNVFYSLHDHHLADLLAAIRHHHEHLHPTAASLVARDVESNAGVEGP
jgi:DNA-binding transcriptional ArsR family regulator